MTQTGFDSLQSLVVQPKLRDVHANSVAAIHILAATLAAMTKAFSDSQVATQALSQKVDANNARIAQFHRNRTIKQQSDLDQRDGDLARSQAEEEIRAERPEPLTDFTDASDIRVQMQKMQQQLAELSSKVDLAQHMSRKALNTQSSAVDSLKRGPIADMEARLQQHDEHIRTNLDALNKANDERIATDQRLQALADQDRYLEQQLTEAKKSSADNFAALGSNLDDECAKIRARQTETESMHGKRLASCEQQLDPLVKHIRELLQQATRNQEFRDETEETNRNLRRDVDELTQHAQRHDKELAHKAEEFLAFKFDNQNSHEKHRIGLDTNRQQITRAMREVQRLAAFIEQAQFERRISDLETGATTFKEKQAAGERALDSMSDRVAAVMVALDDKAGLDDIQKAVDGILPEFTTLEKKLEDLQVYCDSVFATKSDLSTMGESVQDELNRLTKRVSELRAFLTIQLSEIRAQSAIITVNKHVKGRDLIEKDGQCMSCGTKLQEPTVQTRSETITLGGGFAVDKREEDSQAVKTLKQFQETTRSVLQTPRSLSGPRASSAPHSSHAYSTRTTVSRVLPQIPPPHTQPQRPATAMDGTFQRIDFQAEPPPRPQTSDGVRRLRPQPPPRPPKSTNMRDAMRQLETM